MIQDEMMKQLIKEMIQTNPLKRPPAEAILNHPCFWGNDRLAKFLKKVTIFLNDENNLRDAESIEKIFKPDMEIDNWVHKVQSMVYRVKKLPSFKTDMIRETSLVSLLNVMIFSVRFSKHLLYHFLINVCNFLSLRNSISWNVRMMKFLKSGSEIFRIYFGFSILTTESTERFPKTGALFIRLFLLCPISSGKKEEKKKEDTMV